jgi:hypothetical protein
MAFDGYVANQHYTSVTFSYLQAGVDRVDFSLFANWMRSVEMTNGCGHFYR